MLNEGRFSTTLPTLVTEQKPDYWPVSSKSIPLFATDATSPPAFALSPTPPAATIVTASSGNQANANAVAALPAVAAVLNYVTGIIVTASGATAGSDVSVTLVGVVGGTMTFTFTAPAGAAVGAIPLVIDFPNPIPATAVNTAITLTLPALGTGNTNAAVVITGFKI